LIIRAERPEDRPAIARLNREAFGGAGEADLIDRLREDGLVAASLLAEHEGAIAGHILLSWLEVEIGGRPLKALALAPMAVAPDRQRQGIGSRLVTSAIAAARDLEARLILVLGHPEFYRRFGFSSEKAAELENPFRVEAFMALELAPDILRGAPGSVRYPPAFGLKHPMESPQE
jgi:putative acetyltransferase